MGIWKIILLLVLLCRGKFKGPLLYPAPHGAQLQLRVGSVKSLCQHGAVRAQSVCLGQRKGWAGSWGLPRHWRSLKLKVQLSEHCRGSWLPLGGHSSGLRFPLSSFPGAPQSPLLCVCTSHKAACCTLSSLAVQSSWGSGVQVQGLGQLFAPQAGWGLFQLHFTFSIWYFSANSGVFFGFISYYCPFPVLAVHFAFLKGINSIGWGSRVRREQLPGCAAAPSPASGSQSGWPGAAPAWLISLQTLQQGFICSQSHRNTQEQTLCLIWHGAALQRHSSRDGNAQPQVKPSFGKLNCRLPIPVIPVWFHIG